jgi:hypothetical protein
MTLQAMRGAENLYGHLPVMVHELPGVLGWWFGLADAGPKPPEVVAVYLQVGPDAFIPYVWAHCCMPDW